MDLIGGGSTLQLQCYNSATPKKTRQQQKGLHLRKEAHCEKSSKESSSISVCDPPNTPRHDKSQWIPLSHRAPPPTHILPTCVGVNKPSPVSRDVTHQTGRAIKALRARRRYGDQPDARMRRVCCKYDVGLTRVCASAFNLARLHHPDTSDLRR